MKNMDMYYEGERNFYLIGERKKGYTNLLQNTIERVNQELKMIEIICEDGNYTNAEIINKISRLVDSVSPALREFEMGVKDPYFIKSAQKFFREKTDYMFSKSYCFKRTRTWPQGYQGDYKTLETIYRNIPLSKGIGYYLDLYILNVPLAKAVRNRLRLLENIIRYELYRRKEPKVLNIACGSCREIIKLSEDIKETKAEFYCIDNDSDTINYALKKRSSIGLLDYVNFSKYNALRMFDAELNMNHFGKQDIIYSVGFFDYLPSDFLTVMLRNLYDLLNPGGILVAAFKDCDMYDYIPFHWFVDWDGFLQRNESDFIKILSDAGIDFTNVIDLRDKTGIIIFYLIYKKS